MTKKTKWIIVGSVVLCIILSLGIYRALHPDSSMSWSEHDEKITAMKKKLKTLAEQIQSEIGPGVCDIDEECKLAGLGTHTCNGYKDFVLYSTRDTNESVLLRLVRKFNATAQEFNRFSLVAIDCGITPAPVRCINKKCVPILAK